MKKTLQRLATLALVGTMVLSLAACSSSADSETIKIGVIQPRSGSLAVSGEDSYVGQMIAIEQFNEAGGANGTLVEAVVADTPDSSSAQTEVTRLIQQEEVSIITGVYGSSIAEVAASLCDRNDVLYWEAISVTERLTEQGYESVFRTHLNGKNFGLEAGRIAESMAADLGLDNPTVAIVSDNGEFGQAVAVGVQMYADEVGLDIVLDELFTSNLQDASSLVLKMKESDADILICTAYINDAILITKQAKSLEYTPDLWLGIGSGFGLPAYVEALGDDAQAIIDIDPTNNPVVENLDPEIKDLVIDFQERFKETQGYDAPTCAYLEWQTMWVLLNHVVAQVDDPTDIDQLVAASKAVDIPQGFLPTGAGVSFDSTGQNTLGLLSAMQWQDGVLIPVYPDSVQVNEYVDLPLVPWEER